MIQRQTRWKKWRTVTASVYQLFSVVTLFLLAVNSGSAETHRLDEQQTTQLATQIRAVMKAQETAWNRGDIDGLMNGYARSGDATFISGDSVTRGWPTVRDRYKKKYARAEQMGRLSFSDLEVTPLCSDAENCAGSLAVEAQKR